MTKFPSIKNRTRRYFRAHRTEVRKIGQNGYAIVETVDECRGRPRRIAGDVLDDAEHVFAGRRVPANLFGATRYDRAARRAAARKADIASRCETVGPLMRLRRNRRTDARVAAS
jgi:hypothetical protein